MSTQAHLDAAVAELALLGVRAKACWTVREVLPGVGAVHPAVEIGKGTFSVVEAILADADERSDWVAFVAAAARGVMA